MSETPPESDSSPSGEPAAEVDKGEPKAPASGESPSLTPTPRVHAEPAPVPDASVLPTQDADGNWAFDIGDVLDLGEKGIFTVKDRLGRGGADFHELSFRRLTVNGVNVNSTVWMNDDSGTVAVVVDLPNPNDAAPWEPLEGRIISERSSSESPVALRAMPRVIPPGQRGRVALVFNRSAIQDKAMVEILRDSRPDFGVEVTSQELAQRNSPWRSLWPFGER